jgi:DNA-binding response OmpR family regulator
MPRSSSPILLVEDDLSLQGSLCQFLIDQGYWTIAAGTADQARELLRQARPWLCLLDMNLPDGSGLDVLRRIARQRAGPRVVVMTAFDLKHLRPREANGVLAGWMTKPVNPADLLKLVEAEQSRQAAVDASVPAP